MKKISRIMSAIIIICLFCLLTDVSVSAKGLDQVDESLSQYREVLDDFNNEYGTDFYFLSVDELEKNNLNVQEIKDNILSMSLDEFKSSLVADYTQMQSIDSSADTIKIDPVKPPLTRGTFTQFCYLQANGNSSYYGAFTLNANGVDAGVYQYTSVNSIGYQAGISVYEFALTSTSYYFSNSYKNCNVTYSGSYYNSNTGLGITNLRTYNITYTYGGGNLIMNIGNL
ncbi:hypothetical protein [Faecalicatena orotica]|uniref:hypothetical protein n=1 Tax=Faecalicatena orotica TaxID=1544 RepID=UPI0032162B89